jgi:hypothetical protein
MSEKKQHDPKTLEWFNKVIKTSEKEFARDGNPMTVWNTYLLCRDMRMPIPEWVLVYMDKSARRILTIASPCWREFNPEMGNRVLKRLGLSHPSVDTQGERKFPLSTESCQCAACQTRGKPAGDLLMDALGMKTRGKGNIFSRFGSAYIRIQVVQVVMILIKKDPTRMKADIFSEVAEALAEEGLEISNITIENWYNQLQESLTLFL